MYYTQISDLLNDVINFTEDTPSNIYGNENERNARLTHYYNRTVQKIWFARPWWPFRKGSTPLTLSSGSADLPVDFGSIGNDGYVIVTGSRQLPWVGVDYQELLAMRNNNVWPAQYQQNRVYAIGPPSGADTDQMTIMSGNPGDGRSITVYYDKLIPSADFTADLSDPIPLPGYLHEAALAGTIWFSKLSTNDVRADEYRLHFDEALSNGIREGRPKQNRPQQLPMTVGRMY